MIRPIFCLYILSDQKQKCSDKHQFWSENVQCPVCKITACHRTFSRQKHYLSVHVYICMEIMSRWTGEMLIFIDNSINFNTMSRQLHLCLCKFYYILTVYQPMFQKLFRTLVLIANGQHQSFLIILKYKTSVLILTHNEWVLTRHIWIM